MGGLGRGHGLMDFPPPPIPFVCPSPPALTFLCPFLRLSLSLSVSPLPSTAAVWRSHPAGSPSSADIPALSAVTLWLLPSIP